MVQSICCWTGGRGGKHTGSLEDREAEKCQKEVESEGQTRQAQIDGASRSTPVQFSHAGGKTGNNRESEIQAVKSINKLRCLANKNIQMK